MVNLVAREVKVAYLPRELIFPVNKRALGPFYDIFIDCGYDLQRSQHVSLAGNLAVQKYIYKKTLDTLFLARLKA